MKNLLCYCALSCLPLFSYTQKKHELKVDALGLVRLDYLLAYEWIPKNSKLSYEFSLNYNPYYDFNNWEDVPGAILYYRDAFSALASAKYYFSKKKKAAGFYGGTYLRYKIYFNDSDDYKAFHLNEFGVLPKDPRINALALGLSTGYKWLIKDRFIIEPVFGVDVDLYEAIKYESFDLGGILHIKAGYRF